MEDARQLDRGRMLAEISNGMTRLHREAYGRGADSVRTIMQRNYVCSFLEGIYTPVERTLLDAGEQEAVRGTRLAFQRAMEGRFTELVEQATGRKVAAFLSQVAFDPDVAAEIFVLEEQANEPDGEGVGTASARASGTETNTLA